MFLGYRLFYNEKESGKELSKNTKLDRYVLYKTESGTIGFEVRFVETGVYKLQVRGGTTKENIEELCEFRITCDEPMKNCRPLPINPSIGFGPNSSTKQGGLQAESHMQSVVNFRKEKGTMIIFKILKPVNVHTRLFHNEISSDELQQCINQQPLEEGKRIKIKVMVPKSGEYALEINTSEDNFASDDYSNVCNYLLTNDKEDTAQQDWTKVCKTLEISGKHSVQGRVKSFRVKNVDIEMCKKARSICGDYFDDENASDDADAKDIFCDWSLQ
ncbi:hypothetical protein CHS0354_037922 [Potamilus streckersoni]|uniref:KY-like immunoglobulin-like domain-containing protein n=1 Tax=Potamilus streckersoni TaxID=2493646 RepID=A0AAE0T9H5_9BIVA|nr:hypothetical protein CHS0354_037922 [Potamilus streckersoni]